MTLQPLFPKTQLLHPAPLKFLYSIEAKVIQDKFHCVCVYFRYGISQILYWKHSILEQQKTVLMLAKIRQHGITRTL